MKMHFTKMLSVCCAILFGALFTTEANAQCLTAGFGQWPSSTYTPVCNGSVESISTSVWTDEYSVVNVEAGQEYTFSSSVSSHYITISADDGATAAAFGTGSVTWTAASTGTVRFYTHLSSACDGEQTSHTRSVACGSTDCPDGNIGDSCDDGDPNTFGDVLQADCSCAGVPPTGDCLNITSFGSTDLSSAANVLVSISTCSFQSEYSTITGVSVGEDIEFNIVEGGYITVRSDSSNGPVVAQGVAPVTVLGASGSDLFPHWNTDAACGTASTCVETTVQCISCGSDCPDGNIGDPCDDGNPNTAGETIQPDCSCGGGSVIPANDNCVGSIALACGDSIEGTTEGATSFINSPSGCGFTATSQLDVWYSFEANGTNDYTVSVDAGATSSSWDGVLYVYEGTCDSLSELACSDATFSGGSESVTLSAPAAGIYYVQFYDFSGFDAYAVSLSCNENTDCPDGNIGDSCDDGDPNTENDVIGEDCVCAGTPIPEGCLNTSSFGDADISVEGPTGELITISTCSYEEEFSTITGVPAGEDIEFTLSSGGYITVRSDSSDGAVVAEGFSPVTVLTASGSDLFPHWTVDDSCNTDDSCVTTTVQCTTCDTECPDGNIGDPCDDGDPNTLGDVIGEDCVCAGTPATGDCLNTSSFGDADLSGEANNLVTISTCSFQEEYSSITGISAGEDIEFTILEGGYITVRSDSSDGPVVAQGLSPLTVSGASGADLFPHWNTDAACNTNDVCVTTTVQCLTCGTDCPDGNIGDPCDDGNPNTIGETLQPDCSCGGGIVVPDNDNCESAASLNCGDSIDGTTDGATEATNVPSGCGFSSFDTFDVWYSFEANGTDNYLVTVAAGLDSESWDGVLYVYSGSCADTLVEIACSDSTFSGGTEAVALEAPAAGIYYVQFYDYSGTDSYTVSLECESNCAEPFPAVDENSLMTTIGTNSVEVSWDPVDGQIGCQLQLRFANGASITRNIVLGENVGSQTIPGYLLDFDTDYEWRVRCGCSFDPLVVGPVSSWQPFSTPGSAELTSFPNPTEGQSNVTFTVIEESYTTLEVYDMSGRLVDAIFTGVAQPNNDYRFEFDGATLPNGVYIYRLTTESEVINEKFMIAK
jgi:hypothetical protein